METTTFALESLHLGDNSNVRTSFIALFTFWIIWAMLLIADQGMGSEADNGAENAGTFVSKHLHGLHSLHNKVGHAQKLARNLFITLLWMIVASTLGFGLTHGSMILIWIYFAFAVVWVMVDLVLTSGLMNMAHKGIVDGVFGLIEFGLGLTVMSIGYSRGW